MNEVEKYFYTLDDSEELATKKFSWKNFAFGTLAFALLATISRIYYFSFPFISGIAKIEFSVPIVMLCFFLCGPWSALIVMLIKSLVYYFLFDPKLISVVLDIFVTFGMILVCYLAVTALKNTSILKKTIFAGLIATIVVGIGVCIFNYYIYQPVMNKYYNVTLQSIVDLYHNHFSYIDSSIKCVLLFDGPWYASKILLGTIISAIAVKIKSAIE